MRVTVLHSAVRACTAGLRQRPVSRACVAQPPAHEQGMLRALRRTAVDSEPRAYEAALRNRAQALRLRCGISTYRARPPTERTQTLVAAAVPVPPAAVHTTVAE